MVEEVQQQPLEKQPLERVIDPREMAEILHEREMNPYTRAPRLQKYRHFYPGMNMAVNFLQEHENYQFQHGRELTWEEALYQLKVQVRLMELAYGMDHD